jgi:hypothetical protein
VRLVRGARDARKRDLREIHRVWRRAVRLIQTQALRTAPPASGRRRSGGRRPTVGFRAPVDLARLASRHPEWSALASGRIGTALPVRAWWRCERDWEVRYFGPPSARATTRGLGSGLFTNELQTRAHYLRLAICAQDLSQEHALKPMELPTAVACRFVECTALMNRVGPTRLIYGGQPLALLIVFRGIQFCRFKSFAYAKAVADARQN